mmetsp:Transcript_31995/g.73900  ORF Transcript_31995/g.73900 Transcript_31995/m.73900 type:complete len:91 (-) Transcript_31995:451-723(-)
MREARHRRDRPSASPLGEAKLDVGPKAKPCGVAAHERLDAGVGTGDLLLITEHTTGASIPTRHAVLITSVVLEAKGAALVRNDVAGGRKG